MKKNQKVSGPGLYNFVQMDSSWTKMAKYPTSAKKCATSLLGHFFVSIWTPDKHGQMRSNAPKCKGLCRCYICIQMW